MALYRHTQLLLETSGGSTTVKNPKYFHVIPSGSGSDGALGFVGYIGMSVTGTGQVYAAEVVIETSADGVEWMKLGTSGQVTKDGSVNEVKELGLMGPLVRARVISSGAPNVTARVHLGSSGPYRLKVG